MTNIMDYDYDEYNKEDDENNEFSNNYYYYNQT